MAFTKKRIPTYHALMRYARSLRFGDIITRIDPNTGLHAIIAIHNTKLGPAIGGCRLYAYDYPELALKDALRLSYAMTFKAAVCGLNHGGAKAVIIKPPHLTDRKTLFHAFGDLIQSLNGRYIAAVDVGTTIEDMTTIFDRTAFVCGARGPGRIDDDPSPFTARGVFHSIRAALKFRDNRDDFDGLHVAIQGVGHAGYHLAKNLKEAGARVTVTDKNPAALKHAVETLKVETVALEQIETISCDIFSPCAMGGTVSVDMIHRCKAKMIAGVANNQLTHRSNVQLMQDRGILYLPDFLINAGGLLYAAAIYTHQDVTIADKHVEKIYDTMLHVLTRAAETKKTTVAVAEEIAIERLR